MMMKQCYGFREACDAALMHPFVSKGTHPALWNNRKAGSTQGGGSLQSLYYHAC